MKILKFCALLALFFMPAVSATAATSPWVTIPFVNHGNIRDWRPVDHKAILIADAHNQWYKATFFSPCLDLDNVLAVGFVTGPTGTLDKFSSILVRGQRCTFKSLEMAPAPDRKALKADKTT